MDQCVILQRCFTHTMFSVLISKQVPPEKYDNAFHMELILCIF